MNWYEPAITKKPNSDRFIRLLTKNTKKKSCIIVDGGGTALYSGFQSSYLNKGNRIICSSSISSMGTGLAESIGVAKSNKFKKFNLYYRRWKFFNEYSRSSNNSPR